MEKPPMLFQILLMGFFGLNGSSLIGAKCYVLGTINFIVFIGGMIAIYGENHNA